MQRYDDDIEPAKGYIHENIDYATEKGELHEVEQGRDLKRDLKARHISMIAIGGALGTGLLIGTGEALVNAGPAAILISYSFVGFIVFLVMCALGEMATYLPLPDGFSGYATRFCDPALGFAVGWTYWIKYIFVTPNQLTAGALVIQYWVDRDTINPGVWITVILVIILLINLVGVKFFGEFEFWLSSFKILVALMLILLCFIIALGGGPDHDRRGFRYWQDPGAFKDFESNGVHIPGAKGRFMSWVSVLVTSVFAYSGTELVGVTVGEAQNPRRNIPRAIKLTFYRIVVFYVISILFLGMCVPYNDEKLVFAATDADTSASASPFVVAVQNAGIEGLPQFLNAAILVFVFSAANSDLYIATRTLYGLSVNGKAPRFFSKTTLGKWNTGVPFYALFFSAAFCCLAYMNVSSDSAEVFGYFVNMVSILGLLTWISILVTHIGFMKACKAQGIDRKRDLVWSAPFAPYGTYFALGFCIIIALIKNYTVFIGINGGDQSDDSVGKFDYKNFITGYIGIPIYLTLIVGYKLIMRPRRVRPAEADMISMKDAIDEAERLFVEKQEADRLANPPGPWKKIYENTIGMLF